MEVKENAYNCLSKAFSWDFISVAFVPLGKHMEGVGMHDLAILVLLYKLCLILLIDYDFL